MSASTFEIANTAASWKRDRVRVLYSFPHKLGADRICYTAWEQVKGIAAAGADVLLFAGVLSRAVPDSVTTHTTLARGKLRIPYKLLGKGRALALHDHIVARKLEKLAGQVDVVHVWPCAALETIKTAKRLGIPTVLERPNAHTRFAYEVVNQECKRLGVALPKGHEYEFNEQILRREEEEFRLADYLLCPSEFVAKTFRDRGFARSRLLRHQYGFDATAFYPEIGQRGSDKKFTMLFAGQCAVRKGLHFAVDAWLESPAKENGNFFIAGDFIPEYRRYLDPFLKLDPSIIVLGHRDDLPDLMRRADVFVLPSLEEGSPLVCAEAMASGCVNLISDVCTDVCQHMKNALVHNVGDVPTLRQHITDVYKDRDLLARLREGALRKRGEFTWAIAGQSLVRAYMQAISHSPANVSVQTK
jgi:glycosyltransferase involved in cell wall biosynthesis